MINNENKEVITENRLIVENGEVKTILNETTQNSGYITIEEMHRLLYQMVHNVYEYDTI